MAMQYLAIVEPTLDAGAIAQHAASTVANPVDGIIVLPIHVASFVAALRSKAAKTIALVGFPFGASKPVIKAIEATSCLKDGADGAWIVPRWPIGTSPGRLDALRDELLEIARAIRATRRDADFGVVIDATWLRDASEAEVVVRAIREGAADTLVLVGENDFEIDPIASGLSIVNCSARNIHPTSTASTVRGLSFPPINLR